MSSLQLPILWAMLCLYVGAFVLDVYQFFQSNEKLKKAAVIVTVLAVVVNGILVVLRGILIQGLPLNNGFEFGMSFALAIGIIYLILLKKFALSQIGAFIMPISIALSCWLLNLDMSVNPLNPSLRSYWLSFHVTAAVIAYGTFAISFGLAIAFLLREQGKLKKMPEAEVLDEVSYKMVFVGMPFLTIMLITGAVWAEYAWGTFWSWDPKETFALVTWLVYAIYLHIRLMRGWRGKKTAILSIIGFVAVIFTFFGVSYLLPGMHSYIG